MTNLKPCPFCKRTDAVTISVCDDDWNKLAEEVIERRVKLHELRNVLRTEYGIQI